MRSEVRSSSRLFRLLSRSLLQEGFAVRFCAKGRSMFPAMAEGDVVEVCPHQGHARGDVILVGGEDGIRAHRVISSSDHKVVTRGDSCCEPDGFDTPESIIDHVSGVINDNGRRSPHTLRTRPRQLFSRLR